MQFAATILAFAAAAMAAPTQCTFGDYMCSKDGLSIRQCNVSGQWVDVGPCPSGTKCSDVGDIPYCQTTSTKRGQSNSCSAPGTYSCTGDKMGINVCDSQNQLVFNGACPTNTHCGTLNGLPFCVENGVKGY